MNYEYLKSNTNNSTKEHLIALFIFKFITIIIF